jgi:hypothetical protein
MAGAVNGTEKIEMPARMIFDVLELLPIPVIAAINGAAMGGGCEIALACDLRVMSESAKIGLPEIRFGALPGGGGTARLPRVVGFARAKEMIMLGRQLSAATAREYGLVTEVVPQDRVRVRANELAEELSALAPYAVRTAKYLPRWRWPRSVRRRRRRDRLIQGRACRRVMPSPTSAPAAGTITATATRRRFIGAISTALPNWNGATLIGKPSMPITAAAWSMTTMGRSTPNSAVTAPRCRPISGARRPAPGNSSFASRCHIGRLVRPLPFGGAKGI